MSTDWMTVVTGFERSLRRLEQLRSYQQDINTESWRRWSAGDPACIPGADDHDWVAMVRSKTAAGATIERVRVIDDPMTPYQTWLIPASAEIVAAGESHRYVTRLVADRLLDVQRPDGDWWIVDDHTVVYLDGNGWGKVSTVPAEVNGALNVWKRAWGRVPAVA